MPAPRKPVARSEEFQSLSRASYFHGESRDCAVKAVAVVTGCSYTEVHAVMARLGRRPGRGTPWSIIRAALSALGFSCRQLGRTEVRAIIDTYPERDRVLQSVTTHHPVRFARSWREQPTMIFWTNGHVAAFRDGRMHDWTEGRAFRAIGLFVIERVA